MTVAREQCVIVGVTRTVTVVIWGTEGGREEGGRVGFRVMSGRLTTEREPRVRGCSGSWMGAMRSVGFISLRFWEANGLVMGVRFEVGIEELVFEYN